MEYPNHGTIRYQYTPEGYLREVTDQNGHQNCNYQKDRMGHEVHRRFDSNGNILKEERAGGLITEYAYDKNGNRIRSISFKGNIITTDI